MDYQLDENYEVTKGEFFETRVKHPAFGTFRVNRSHSGDHPLFGSSIMHRDTITLTVSHASMQRDLHSDWIHNDRPIVEFEMSYTQFMDAICNQLSGTGIPCTIQFTEKDGKIPEMKFINKQEEFRDEFRKKVDETNKTANGLYKEVKELFETKKSLSKTDRNLILQKIDQIINAVPNATVFAQQTFAEQMEQSVCEARGEIESFFQARVSAIASAAISEHPEAILSIGAPNIPKIADSRDENP